MLGPLRRVQGEPKGERGRADEVCGEPCDPDRIVADLDHLADGQLTADEAQTFTEQIEVELATERERPTMWKEVR